MFILIFFETQNLNYPVANYWAVTSLDTFYLQEKIFKRWLFKQDRRCVLRDNRYILKAIKHSKFQQKILSTDEDQQGKVSAFNNCLCVFQKCISYLILKNLQFWTDYVSFIVRYRSVFRLMFTPKMKF